jgi:hypothetical protein
VNFFYFHDSCRSNCAISKWLFYLWRSFEHYRWIGKCISLHYGDKLKLSREPKGVVDNFVSILLLKPGLIYLS